MSEIEIIENFKNTKMQLKGCTIIATMKEIIIRLQT